MLARIQTNINTATLHRQNEDHLRMLIDELNHRVKNTLATVQAVVSQTLRGTAAADTIKEAIESRLFALSMSHDLLSRENWKTARLHDIAKNALSPFTAEGQKTARYTINGDETRLPPKTVLTLSMALHELATNAMKYGALSNATGSIAITWHIDENRLKLRWEERDGPAVSPPSRKGFGSRLIERSLAAEIDGTVRLEYLPTGVVCSVDMLLPDGTIMSDKES